MSLAPIPEALDALRAGRPVIVADDENRENEGDVVLSAALATPEWIAWTVKHSSGFICAPMPADWADRLDLPPMVALNQDSRGTAYTVSVDAADRSSTGISAADRAHTLNVLGDAESGPASVIRPGHILPLRAVDGGVRERGGHTEAAVELMRLAGLPPVGAIAEVVADDGSMMRLPGLLALGERDGIPVITIEQLVAHLDATDPEGAPAVHRRRVSLRAEATVPTSHGVFRFLAYKDRVTGTDHVAVVSGDLSDDAPLVRVHSECLTGEAFGSLKCECGPQLDAALDAIARDGGVVIYMRGHEGRGIGLINKLRAYGLQERGLDTVDANLALGLPADARDYAAAAGILADLGIERVRLLTNNTDKVAQLRERGLDIVEQVPLIVGVGPNNHQYLETKRDRMGHLIDEQELADALVRMREGADHERTRSTGAGGRRRERPRGRHRRGNLARDDQRRPHRRGPAHPRRGGRDPPAHPRAGILRAPRRVQGRPRRGRGRGCRPGGHHPRRHPALRLCRLRGDRRSHACRARCRQARGFRSPHPRRRSAGDRSRRARGLPRGQGCGGGGCRAAHGSDAAGARRDALLNRRIRVRLA